MCIKPRKVIREAEFVAASETGQGVVYLRVLHRGFGYPKEDYYHFRSS
jgi:hypothetical protein